MEKKYNIKINPPGLTKDQIARHQDFDALLEKYHHERPGRKPVMRRLIYLSGAIAATIALFFLVFQGLGEEEYPVREADYFAEQPYVDPPLRHIEPTFASYKVNADAGGIYEYPSGSKLVVPAAAFAGENGEPVEGEVTIHYREMHDFVDFFLSGIPMSYDSAGVQYTLESAGMIEMFAEQAGKRVNMTPGKSIEVELVSHVNVSPEMAVPAGYNIYQLDKQKRNWVYQEIDRMQLLEDDLAQSALDENDPLYTEKKELREKIQAIEVSRENELAGVERSMPKPREPVKPQKAFREDHVFDLDFNDLKNPNATGELAATQQELAALYDQYEKMLWQLSPQSAISPDQLQNEFSAVTGISIRKLNNRDYELILEKDDQKLEVIVNPVLSGSDYDEALADFNRDFTRWQQDMAAREAQLKGQKNAIEQRFAEDKRLASLKYKERIAELRSNGLEYAATEEIIKRKVVNRFQATGFGIWNCDRPLPPEIYQLAAEFRDQNGRKFQHKTGFLVDKSRNTVYRFLAEDGAQLRFNANSENLLWIVTEDNKIAVFRPDRFKLIQEEDAAYSFELETIDKVIEDEKDVREILYL